jgi:hypothetical protein
MNHDELADPTIQTDRDRLRGQTRNPPPKAGFLFWGKFGAKGITTRICVDVDTRLDDHRFDPHFFGRLTLESPRIAGRLLR